MKFPTEIILERIKFVATEKFVCQKRLLSINERTPNFFGQTVLQSNMELKLFPRESFSTILELRIDTISEKKSKETII